MEHHVHVRKRPEVRVAQVQLEQAETRVAQRALEVAPLERGVVVVREAVHAGDRDAVGEQPVGKRRADEPGGSGHQCADGHAGLLGWG